MVAHVTREQPPNVQITAARLTAVTTVARPSRHRADHAVHPPAAAAIAEAAA